VQIHSETKEIKQAGLYWALVQYARAIRRGAVIVASHDANGVRTGSERVLFVPPGPLVAGTGIRTALRLRACFTRRRKNPDGSIALVLDESGRSKRADGGLRRFDG